MHKKNASTQAIDTQVGAQIRWHRMAKGMTQEGLANAVGITYQQLYKYECGSNSASASRLSELASALKIPISYFFEGIEIEGEAAALTPISSKREHTLFLNYYLRIRSYEERKIIRDLIRVLSLSRTSE